MHQAIAYALVAKPTLAHITTDYALACHRSPNATVHSTLGH